MNILLLTRKQQNMNERIAHARELKHEHALSFLDARIHDKNLIGRDTGKFPEDMSPENMKLFEDLVKQYGKKQGSIAGWDLYSIAHLAGSVQPVEVGIRTALEQIWSSSSVLDEDSLFVIRKG